MDGAAVVCKNFMLTFRGAHSSVKCNTVTNVGKKLRREFYSLVFCAVCCLVDSEFV